MTSTTINSDILAVDHLSMRFGGIVAVNDLSFTAKRGDITALIGPNGAGKTTVFNCITGFYKPTTGMMRLIHEDSREFLLERLFDYRISKVAKVARTFQNIRLFSGMTALENLMVAQHNSADACFGLYVSRTDRRARLPPRRSGSHRTRVTGSTASA
jgi:branched-chain amino acid transport system ATP-binding protein